MGIWAFYRYRYRVVGAKLKLAYDPAALHSDFADNPQRLVDANNDNQLQHPLDPNLIARRTSSWHLSLKSM